MDSTAPTSTSQVIGFSSESYQVAVQTLVLPPLLSRVSSQDNLATFEYDATDAMEVHLNTIMDSHSSLTLDQAESSNGVKKQQLIGMDPLNRYTTLLDLSGTGYYIASMPSTEPSLATALSSGEATLGAITPDVTSRTPLSGAHYHESVKSQTECFVDKPKAERPFFCTKCLEKFNQLAAFKKHLKAHEEEKKFKCHSCEESFNVETNLVLHQVTHNTESLKCPECGRHFQRMASFKSHLAIHFEEDNLTCPECEQEFINEHKLAEHTKKYHGSRAIHEVFYQDEVSSSRKYVLRCRECNSSFASLSTYNAHLSTHLRNGRKPQTKPSRHPSCRKTRKLFKSTEISFKNRCRFCDKSFRKASQCARHELIHTGIKPFECQMCQKTFNQKNALDMHIRTHTGFKPNVCHICAMKFTQKGNLWAHITRVHNLNEMPDSLYKCDKCPCTFKKIGSLNAHVSKFHLSISDRMDDAGAEMKMLPQKRGRPLPRGPRVSGESHMVIAVKPRHQYGQVRKHLVQVCHVNGAKLYLCNFCEKRFDQPSDLCRHVRVHILEKPFKCKMCCRAFSIKSALKVHLRIHLAPPDHGCRWCLLKFTSAHSLKAHEKMHLLKIVGREYNVWQCHLCQKFCKSSLHLKMHVSCHVRQEMMKRHRSRWNQSPDCLVEPYVIVKDRILPTLARYRPWHQLTAYERPSFRCTSCPAHFKASSHLKQHLQMHSGAKPFSCRKCGQLFVSRSSLSSHLNSQCHRTIYQCTKCPKNFNSADAARRHVLSHDEEKLFLCPYCSKAFKTDALCKIHMKIHQGPPQSHHVLDYGHFSAVTPVEEVKPLMLGNDVCQSLYVEAASQSTPATAVICSSSNQVIANLSTDLNLMQLPGLLDVVEDVNVAEAGGSPSVFATAIVATNSHPVKPETASSPCHLSMSEKVLQNALAERDRVSEMKSASQIAQERPVYAHQCDTCPRSFKKPSDLVRHQRIHTGEKPFACDQCQRRFSVKSTLQTHLKIHVNQATSAVFKCHLCSVQLASVIALKAHMRLHTGAKPFVCPHCDQRFRTSGQRRSHMSSHSSTPSATPDASAQPIASSPRKRNDDLLSVTIPATSVSQALQAANPAGDSLLGATVRLQVKRSDAMNILAQLVVDEDLLHQLQTNTNFNLILNPLQPEQSADTDSSCPTKQRDNEEREECIIADEGDEDDVQAKLSDEEVLMTSAEAKSCLYCHKSFMKPSQLQRHLRIHTGEKPFSCSLCSKSFSQKSSLHIHQKKHTGERPFVCPFCSFAFTQKGNLKTHIQRCHAQQAQQLLQRRAVTQAT